MYGQIQGTRQRPGQGKCKFRGRPQQCCRHRPKRKLPRKPLIAISFYYSSSRRAAAGQILESGPPGLVPASVYGPCSHCVHGHPARECRLLQWSATLREAGQCRSPGSAGAGCWIPVPGCLRRNSTFLRLVCRTGQPQSGPASMTCPLSGRISAQSSVMYRTLRAGMARGARIRWPRIEPGLGFCCVPGADADMGCGITACGRAQDPAFQAAVSDMPVQSRD